MLQYLIHWYPNLSDIPILFKTPPWWWKSISIKALKCQLRNHQPKPKATSRLFHRLAPSILCASACLYFNCWTENTAGNKCLQIWLDYLILYICIDLVVDVLAILAICFYQKLKLKEAYNAFRKDFHSDIVQLIQKNSCSSEMEKKTWHQASFLKALSCKA